MLISFIIPAYNASATIRRCLDSIYALPIEESLFEVIAIDDCSTDNTVELVKDYASGYSNLVLLIQNENHRQGAARNKGITIAKGKYVVFVDSDDETAEGVITAVQLAEENDLDMVAIRCTVVGQEGKIDREVSLPYNRDKVFTGMELQTEFAFWGTAPWHYIYKKSFLEEVDYRFVEDVLYEDSDFVNVHLFYAKRMSYCDERGYVVHYNSASTTRSLSYKHLCDYALLGTRMLNFYESLEDKTTKYAEGILEGGSYNIMKAFRKLPRLMSRSEVRSFYDRFDGYCNRKTLLKYRKPEYCWTRWTRFGLKHRNFVVSLLGLAAPVLKMYQKNSLFYGNSNRIQ